MDEKFRTYIEKLHIIAEKHYANEHDDNEIDEASRILTLILVCTHDINNARSVQITQVEDNISEIRRTLNQQSIKGAFPNISHRIDNLATYCGVNI